MQIMKVDPRALKENPGRMRQSKSSPQADADAGDNQGRRHRPAASGFPRRRMVATATSLTPAIAASASLSPPVLEEIEILVADAANDIQALGTPCARWSKTAPARSFEPGRSMARHRTARCSRLDRGGDRRRSLPSRPPDPQSCASSPMSCQPCSSRWRWATCHPSSSCG